METDEQVEKQNVGPRKKFETILIFHQIERVQVGKIRRTSGSWQKMVKTVRVVVIHERTARTTCLFAFVIAFT